jgi:hypothetical protein
VRHAVEGQQVMHAQRVKRDALGDDQLVVVVIVGKGRRPEWLRGEQLGVGVGHATGRLAQRLGMHVGAERPQELPGCLLDGRPVDPADCVLAGRQREFGKAMLVRAHVWR